MSPNQLKIIVPQKSRTKDSTAKGASVIPETREDLSCPLSHGHTWEGVTGAPHILPQAALRGRLPGLESVPGSPSGGSGKEDGQKCQGPPVPLGQRRRTGQGVGGQCGLPTTHPIVFTALGMPQCSTTQLFILQETTGCSEPLPPHEETRKNAHPSLPDSGCRAGYLGACPGRHHGGGRGHPASHKGLWFCSPQPPSVGPPRTCRALCLHGFGPNQIIWASGSRSGRFPRCSAPLQMDKTSGLNTNYVSVTHGWVFLA